MSCNITLKEYEKAQDRADVGRELIDNLKMAIKDLEGNEDFKKYADELEEMTNEVESEISEDIEKVEEYEQDEYESEYRSFQNPEI